MSKKCLVIVLTIIFSTSKLLWAAGSGTTGAIILKHNYSPRAEALAEAFTAVADDINAIYWNPGGLSYLQRDEVMTSLSRGLMDNIFGQISYAHSLTQDITLGGSFLTYAGGAFELLDDSGNSRNLNSQQDFLAALSISFLTYSWVPGYLSAGITFQFLHSTLLEDVSGMTAAATIGVSYKTNYASPFRVGLSVKNIGFPLGYGGQADPLPLTGQLGAAYQLLKSPLTKPAHDIIIAIDAGLGLDTPMYINLGTEYWFQNLLAGRLGYKINRDLEGFSFGLGVRYPLTPNMPIQLDYSLSLAAKFDPTHKLALTLGLPQNPKRWTEEKWLAKQKADKELVERRKAVEMAPPPSEPVPVAQPGILEQKPKASDKKIPAEILEIQKSGGIASKVILNVGRDQQVRVGFTGIILNSKGRPVAGMIIRQVDPKLSLAEVIGLGQNIGNDATAVVYDPLSK